MTWSPRSTKDLPVINDRMVGVEDWQLWRDLRLEALQEAPYAFGSTLAEWRVKAIRRCGGALAFRRCDSTLSPTSTGRPPAW